MNGEEEIQKLKDEVAKDVTVMGSAKVLITGLAGKLRDAVASAEGFEALKAAVNEQADALDAGADDLAAAVTENTPAEPPVE